jgi:hypothetical protein
MENTKSIISLENLLKDSWRIYRDNFKKLVTISILAFSPLLLIMVFSWLPKNSLLVILNLILIVAAIYFGVIGSIMLVLFLKNRDLDLKNLMVKSKPLFWQFFGLSLLSGLLLVLLYLALIIPGIIFSIFWVLASYVLIFEKKLGMAALKRSRELVKGYWWAIFARYLVYIIIYVILSMTVYLLFFWAKEGTSFFYLGQIINYITSFIFMPFSVVFFFVLYRNLKVIKA